MAIMELEDFSLCAHEWNGVRSICLLIRILVVVYLGMRVNRIAGIKTLVGFGPKISSSAAAQPDGLLRHETIIYSLFPMHVGMRQYWRDANSLLEWTRSDPHRQWWHSFLRDSGRTGFWHETYLGLGWSGRQLLPSSVEMSVPLGPKVIQGFGLFVAG